MANTSSLEDTTRETAALARITTLDAGTIPTLRGVPLSDCWQIGDQIPTDSQKHANVHQVVDRAGLPIENLEAHAFDLDNTLPKIRKHRLRCIKRMSQRTRLEIKVEEFAIIVISTLPITDIQASDKGEIIEAPHGPEPDWKPATRSSYKQESRRVRQRERRQAKRAATVGNHFDTAELESEGEGAEIPIWNDAYVDADCMEFLTLIWILYLENGTLAPKLPAVRYCRAMAFGGSSLQDLLEEYLGKLIDIKMDTGSPVPLGSLLEAQREAKSWLQRQLARVPSADKYRTYRLRLLKLQQEVYPQLKAPAPSEAEATLQCEIVAYAKAVLPRVLASRESDIRSVEERHGPGLNDVASAELREGREAHVHDMDPAEASELRIYRLLGDVKVAGLIWSLVEYVKWSAVFNTFCGLLMLVEVLLCFKDCWHELKGIFATFTQKFGFIY